LAFMELSLFVLRPTRDGVRPGEVKMVAGGLNRCQPLPPTHRRPSEASG